MRFVAANDPERRFAFLSLQSPRARELLGPSTSSGQAAAGANEPDSIVLLAGGRRYERSDAALHIALGLRAPWPLAFIAILVPRRTRDAVYGWIARNRYRWFGRTDTCALPPPGLRERFLPEDAHQPAP
ncbi:MAG: DCC1-like thiol-disulfide oxidoreductase family protein [Candidatus Eremiobacteraeota bacterium]|nr:DCC1-like thiol-disulfide oxidoreductase family protein [Candidatus Eremiobacteraeota bacterium]